MDNVILAAVLLLPVMMIGVKYWQKSLVIALMLVIFEGALRKWAFPGSERIIYFAKDVFILVAYIGFLSAHGLKIPRFAGAVVLLAVVSAAYGAMEIGNPALPAVSLGLVGWKSYFFYIPLIIVVPYAFSSDEQVYRFLNRYLIIIGPIAALGAFQFYSSPGSAVNAYARTSSVGNVSVFEGSNIWHVRATGTFSYITGYSIYAMAMSFLAIGLLGAREWKWKEGRWLYVGLAASVIACLTTGSRAPVFSIGLLFPFYLIHGFLTGDLAGKRAVRLFFGLLVLILAVKFGMKEAVTAFQLRATGSGGTIERMFGPLIEPFRLMGNIGIFGFGIGSLHQAASAIVGSSLYTWTGGLIVENESSRVMAELGIVGFVLVYVVRIVLLAQAVLFSFKLGTIQGRSMAAAIAMFFAVGVTGTVVFNPTADVYYWFAAGLLYYLVISDRKEIELADVPANENVIRESSPLPAKSV